MMQMFGLGESEDAHRAVYGSEKHKSSLTHELIAGAAAFEAMRAYEKKEKASGEKVDHGFLKEMIAGIAAAEADKLFETKGLDMFDRERAKRHASEQAKKLYEEKYMREE